MHQTRSKSSRNGTEHSAISCAQNQHLPNLLLFQSATWHVKNWGDLNLQDWKMTDHIAGLE